MKRLFLVGGTMGVGKTTTCQALKQMLPNCVFLDGDWCWDMHPYQVTDETKQMVMKNIAFLLNNFIACSCYENIVFGWVMHEQGIIDDLLGRLDVSACSVHAFSLVCGEAALKARLEKDVQEGIRAADIVARSLARLSLYDKLATQKIDVSHITPQEAAKALVAHA